MHIQKGRCDAEVEYSRIGKYKAKTGRSADGRSQAAYLRRRLE